MLPCFFGRDARPSPLSTYTYTPSGASPAHLASNNLKSARLPTRHSGFALGYPLASLGPHCVRRLPLRERVWQLCRSSSRGARSRSRYRSPSRRSRRLHAAARRNTSSAGYSLLVLRRAAPPNRRTAPRRVTPLDAQPSSALPQFDSFPIRHVKISHGRSSSSSSLITHLSSPIMQGSEIVHAGK